MPISSEATRETRAYQVIYGWLAVSTLYVLVPLVALLAFDAYLGPVPVLLSYVVYMGALLAGAHLCSLAIRSRRTLHGIVGASVTMGSAFLIYVTLTYCPR